jgi:hypothetical protein
MAAAGSDIKNAPVFVWGGERHHPSQAFAKRVRFAGEIVSRGFTKLFLDEGFAHGLSRSVPAHTDT